MRCAALGYANAKNQTALKGPDPTTLRPPPCFN